MDSTLEHMVIQQYLKKWLPSINSWCFSKSLYSKIYIHVVYNTEIKQE